MASALHGLPHNEDMKLTGLINALTNRSFPLGHSGSMWMHEDDPCACQKEPLRSGCRMDPTFSSQKSLFQHAHRASLQRLHASCASRISIPCDISIMLLSSRCWIMRAGKRVEQVELPL